MAGSSRAAAGAAAAIASSYLAVRFDRAEVVDRPVRLSLATRHHPDLDRAIGAATDLGSIYALAGVCTVLTATGRRRSARDVAIAGGVAWTAAQAAKPLLDRHRPYDRGEAKRLVAEPAGTSWPSGHAALAAAMAGALTPEVGRYGRLGLWAGVAGVGLSRCYVGVHHLTDVVAGVGVGVLSARLARTLSRNLGRSTGRR